MQCVAYISGFNVVFFSINNLYDYVNLHAGSANLKRSSRSDLVAATV